jgi:hypothetical protein
VTVQTKSAPSNEYDASLARHDVPMSWRIALFLIALAATARPAAACVRAAEANKLVGWSADGKYALYELVANGAIEHAEILPTSYAGDVYTITSHGDQIVVARVPVGATPSFGDDGETIVEHAHGRLTDTSLMALATVAAFKFGPAEPAKDAKVSAAFTGKKRYDVHAIEITAGATKTVLPLPVYCVGSCLADENWTRWTITVEAVHQIGGVTLYDLTMANVCNGGSIRRVITQTPASVKIPKQRSTGSGDQALTNSSRGVPVRVAGITRDSRACLTAASGRVTPRRSARLQHEHCTVNLAAATLQLHCEAAFGLTNAPDRDASQLPARGEGLSALALRMNRRSATPTGRG